MFITIHPDAVEVEESQSAHAEHVVEQPADEDGSPVTITMIIMIILVIVITY